MPDRIITSDKNILAITRSELFKKRYFNGFVDRYFPLCFDGYTWRERDGIEDDFSLKQIIPYVVLQNANRVFTYRRSKQAGEARLHNQVSIGIGGHIKQELDDGITFHNTLQRAMKRELEEEVEIDFIPDTTLSGYGSRLLHIGYLNDDSNSVGRVHFGFVYRMWLNDEEAKTISLREPELCDATWKDQNDFGMLLAEGNCENWTRLLFPALVVHNEFPLEST